MMERITSFPRRLGPVLTFPLLILVMLSMIECGRGLMIAGLLKRAARQVCCLAAADRTANSDLSAAVAGILTAAGIDGEAVTVEVKDGAAKARTEVTVTVSVPISAVTWMPVPRHLGGNLSGQCTLRRL